MQVGRNTIHRICSLELDFYCIKVRETFLPFLPMYRSQANQTEQAPALAPDWSKFQMKYLWLEAN